MHLLAIHIAFEKYVDLLPVLTELFVFLQRITDIPSSDIFFNNIFFQTMYLKFLFCIFLGRS